MSEEKPKVASKIKQRTVTTADLDKKYESDYKWKQSNLDDAYSVRTTVEMVAYLERHKDAELDARIYAINETEKKIAATNLDSTQFVEAFKKNQHLNKPFRESFATGGYGYNGFSSGTIPYLNTVGNDYTPLLGGPFYKQLYYYNDWLKAHQDCFYAYHHDPYGKASVNIIIDFTLGRGYKVQCENPTAQAIWDAFEEANDFRTQFENYCKELSIYGENIFWWLPQNSKYINFDKTLNSPQDFAAVDPGFLPRVRVIDPSNIIEIVTHPEDITNKLFYVWLTPTQYQIYGGKDQKTGEVVPTIKFIYQQIPAEQMMHYKINAVSNEKRGRSDLFTALPYFKRLRDSVNYSIIAQQKASAWAIDTTIEGDENDIATYMNDQAALSTIPPAGSEYVHTAAIKREYLGNTTTGSGGGDSSFEWSLSMIAASVGIPISYYGSHLSGGQTKASAIVATEPVAKRFEMRQQLYKQVLTDIAKRLFKRFNIKSDIEITFPELATQDRSAKLKDLYMGQTAKWWSEKRAAETAAKEMGYDDYNFEQEQELISAQAPEPMMAAPLTDEGSQGNTLTSDDKKEFADNERGINA